MFGPVWIVKIIGNNSYYQFLTINILDKIRRMSCTCLDCTSIVIPSTSFMNKKISVLKHNTADINEPNHDGYSMCKREYFILRLLCLW